MSITHETIKDLIGNKKNITIFEIGCADGVDSKKFLEVFGSELKLYTFDPDPLNAFLMTNLNYQDAFGGNNDILVNDNRHQFNQYAICDYDGKIEFNRSRNTNGPTEGYNWGRYSGSIHKPKTYLEHPKYGKRWDFNLFDEKIKVDCITIDSFCQNNYIDHIDFVWMDTQGAEREVLNGAKNSLKNIDYIYTEYYDEEMYEGCPKLEEIKKMLPEFDLIQEWRFHDADGGDVLFGRRK